MDILQRLFYTALGAASLFFIIVKVSLSHWKNRGILHEKPKFLMGNMSGIGRKRHISGILMQLYEKYKGRAPFIGCYAFLKPMVLVLDLDMVEHVLVKDAHYFKERGLYNNVDDEPLSENLMQLDGERWQQLRDKLLPCFAADKLQLLLPTLLKVCNTLQRSLEAQICVRDVFAINNVVECYNVDVISTMAFGLEGESLIYGNTEFLQMTRCTVKNFNWARTYFALHFPNLARLMWYRDHEQTTTEYFLKLVHDKIFEREWNRVRPQNDFLQMFAEFKRLSNPAERLNEKQIAAQLFSFVLVGLRTCNSTMTFCLYELALQPDLQDQVRNEIRRVLDEHNGKLNLKGVQEMHLLKQVLYETLRKYSPYAFLLRNTTTEYEVPNSVFMLQKNNHLVIPIDAIHHDPDIYPEPHRFDPERFSASAIQQRHPMAFLPFGVGPRNCISQEFAELQMLLGLATFLRDYSVSPCAQTVIPMAYDNARVVLTPKCDIMLKLQHV